MLALVLLVPKLPNILRKLILNHILQSLICIDDYMAIINIQWPFYIYYLLLFIIYLYLSLINIYNFPFNVVYLKLLN